MAKRALSWKRAGAIGWRDLRSAPGKFGFVVLSVAVGVAALVGVRGFSDSFRRTLSTEARALMAGDLSARLFHEPTAEEMGKIAAVAQPSGIRTTWVTETVSMASVPPDPVPLLVSLKAVDPNEYPYYGEAELEPAMRLQQALNGDSAVVAEEFLIRLNARVGQTLRLGGRDFRIAAVLKQEPDRISAGAGLGPRVMISQAALQRTGLLSPGSRASQRLLLKLPPQADAPLHLATLRKQVEAALPDAQVMDFREGNPGLNKGLDNATAILSLICLVAMVLGAIGVAMAMHAHLEQRMDMLAILKAVGASSSDLLRIFLLQTLGLGLAGGVLGVAAGVGVMAALPAVFGNLLPVHATLDFPWRSVAAGLGTGLLTTLLFCLPPLLDVRNIRPVLVLRRLVEQGPEGSIEEWIKRPLISRLMQRIPSGILLRIIASAESWLANWISPPIKRVLPSFVLKALTVVNNWINVICAQIDAWFARWWARRLQLGISVVVIAALGGIGWALSDSVTVGGWFALLFTIALVVLLALAAAALRALRFLLNHVRLRLPSFLRHGLANLYRPGNQSAAVLASLGTGVMLILTVFLVQAALLRDLHETASPKLPNVFLVDISTGEVAGVKEFFQRQSGVSQVPGQSLDLMPVVTGRFISLNGKPVEQLKEQHFPPRLLQNAELSWADAPRPGDKVTQGKWWTNADAAELAVGEGAAQRLHLGVGSTVELDVGGVVRALKVSAIYRADGQHLGARVAFVLPSGQMKNEPATWYGGAHIDPKQIAAMERALFAAYPTVSVINVADVLERIESVVDQITFVVRFLAGFSIFAGLMILASSIAGTRFRRMREAVVLKTLGATRMRIVRTFSVEFSVLGLLAGSVGVVFANLLTRVLLHKLDVDFHIEWLATVVSLLGTAVLATATGWIASYRILGLRPLEVLREE